MLLACAGHADEYTHSTLESSSFLPMSPLQAVSCNLQNGCETRDTRKWIGQGSFLQHCVCILQPLDGAWQVGVRRRRGGEVMIRSDKAQVYRCSVAGKCEQVHEAGDANDLAMYCSLVVMVSPGGGSRLYRYSEF
jgi:hypothetical protein